MLAKLTQTLLALATAVLALAFMPTEAQAGNGKPRFIDVDSVKTDLEFRPNETVYLVWNGKTPKSEFKLSGKPFIQLPANVSPLIVKGTIIGGFSTTTVGVGDLEITTPGKLPSDKPTVRKVNVRVLPPLP